MLMPDFPLEPFHQYI